MGKVLFVEGVSGVGKTTTARNIAERLQSGGIRTRCYLEFDAANPIDFYATAYLTREEYEAIQAEYSAKLHPIEAGEAVLVRYSDGDRPLFEGTLLNRLRQNEFCYHPARLIPLTKYTAAYEAVWKNYFSTPPADVLIFDGSFLHHPINDMMRNYQASNAQAAAHVSALLRTLGGVEWQLVYLYTEDIGVQLARAHRDRNQNAPAQDEIAFWQERYRKDKYVLQHSVKRYQTYDVTENGWDAALERILSSL